MTNPYSRILAVEVWNFMSIEHGRVEFDESNIINLKGYNDSGKSSIITALRVALLNLNQSKQASFIQDDKEYFRVVVYFDDGVQLLRDKYINGQSLIEMYKDGQCIFSTKSGRTLTRVTDIPQEVADYLGLVTFDGGSLNARSCFEKQLGVQTSGSENYKMFNTVLKSEEIAAAGAMLNNDKNKLASDISAIDHEIQAQRSLLGDGDKITVEMISWLKEHDNLLDTTEGAEEALSGIQAIANAAESINVYPEVPVVDANQLMQLEAISGVVSHLSETKVAPEVPLVDGSGVEALVRVVDIAEKLEGMVVAPEVPIMDAGRVTDLIAVKELFETMNTWLVSPEVPSIDHMQIDMLNGMCNLLTQLNECINEIDADDRKLSETMIELQHLQVEAENHGSKFVKCPNCGELFDPESSHLHG